MKNTSKTALICGISGQDSAYLAEFLLQKGYTVLGTSRNCIPTAHSSKVDGLVVNTKNLHHLNILNRVELIQLNPLIFEDIVTLLNKYQPAEIYNLSGQSSVEKSFVEPLQTFYSHAVENLHWLEAIRQTNPSIKYYFAASSECFGDTDLPATEETPFKPMNIYATAKASGFFQVQNYRNNYNLHACSGIMFNHESNLRPEHFVTQKIVRTACRIANGSKEKLLLGNIQIIRDWGWAPEFVEAMWLMLQQDVIDDYILATGKSYSLKEFVCFVFNELQLDYSEHIEISDSLLRPSDIMVSKASIDKITRKLSWKPQLTTPDIVKNLVKFNMSNISKTH